MDDEDLVSLLTDLIKDAESYRDELQTDRLRAQEYYDGTMKDTASDDGRSSVVSKDVRSALKKVLPSIMRTILGNSQVVEYAPVGEGDEEMAESATEFVNLVVFPESDGYNAVKDAMHDALLMRNGILKWWFDEKVRIEEEEFTGLDDMSMAELVNSDDVEVLNHSESQETIHHPHDPSVTQDVTFHDVRIRRQVKDRKTKLRCVPLEEFLISPDALDITETAQLVGTHTLETRSDLVAMGYDREQIDALATSERDDNQDAEKTSRRDTAQNNSTASKAMEDIDYYDLYIRCDYDNDGIAELRHLCIAGSIKEGNILHNEVISEVPFCDVVSERRPHQWEGTSLFDDAWDIQRIKTVLLRATLDNLYWQNNQQPIVDVSKVQNPESILKRAFGEPIMLNQGANAAEVVNFSVVPLFAKDSFGMLSYMDEALADRTGVSDAAGGMAPDALQNMTAKGTALIEQMGISQIEEMVRTIAESLKPMFRGLLKMIVRHQDKPRQIRLRDGWVTYDPSTWSADMDCTVNTGLGAGTRERDMMVMHQVIGLQKELLMSFGPIDNPFVTPDNLYNAIEKMVQASGLKTAELFFTKPKPEVIQQKMQQAAQKKSPEEIKGEVQKQVEQMKGQVTLQVEQGKAQTDLQKHQQLIQLKTQEAQVKAQADAAKERAQAEADIVVNREEMQADMMVQGQKISSEERMHAEDIQVEREKMRYDQQMEQRRLAHEDSLKREQMQRSDDVAYHKIDNPPTGKK